MFPPKTRADVGMVQCVPARYGKTTWRKNRRNKEEHWSMQREGASRSMQQGGPVHAKPRSLTCADFEYVFTIPTSCMDRPSLLHGPTGPLSLHGPALLLVPTIFPPGGFAIPCRYTLHHPYICPCFWRKHFYIPLFLHFLWNANYAWASQLLRLPNNSGNKGALHVPALLVAWTDCPLPPFAWTDAPPCSNDFSARWFCHTLQVHTCTIPTQGAAP